MSDETEVPEETRALREAREAAERQKERADGLESQLTELRGAQRVTGIRQAGIEPDSITGQVVLAAAEHDGIYGADDIAALARVVQAEARGELQEEVTA